MATFAIGDVHGCFRTLKRLLDKMQYRPGIDQIWLVGDLVNRGPGSLGVARWAADSVGVDSILGNHDLHFLACARGLARPRTRDTLQELLKARECSRLVEWLQGRPLLAESCGHWIVHAGLLPSWSLQTARTLAADVQSRLQQKKAAKFLADIVGRRGLQWDEKLSRRRQAVAAAQVFTLLRTCRPDGSRCLGFTGPPEAAPAPCRPWYALRPAEEAPIVFGHWAALGYRRLPGAFALDSGCGWGGKLSAVRLEDGKVFRIKNRDLARSSSSRKR